MLMFATGSRWDPSSSSSCTSSIKSNSLIGERRAEAAEGVILRPRFFVRDFLVPDDAEGLFHSSGSYITLGL